METVIACCSAPEPSSNTLPLNKKLTGAKAVEAVNWSTQKSKVWLAAVFPAASTISKLIVCLPAAKVAAVLWVINLLALS